MTAESRQPGNVPCPLIPYSLAFDGFLMHAYVCHLTPESAPSQLREDRLGARSGDALRHVLLGIDNLAVVDDDGVAIGPRAATPADALGEGSIGVAHEDLPQCVRVPSLHKKAQRSISQRVTYNRVVEHAVCFPPSSHNPMIIAGEDDDCPSTRVSLAWSRTG